MTDKITLQVNTAGAWKNVAQFDAARRVDVTLAVDQLAAALGGDTRWCYLHADGTREWLGVGK